MKSDLIIITDTVIARGRSHAEIARCAIAGGADLVQLRDKALATCDLLREACELRAITRRSGTTFVVNDRVDIALASGADGVHLGQQDLPLSFARRIVPGDFIIGISVGSVGEAVRAETEGASYVALSPTFSTTSKDDAGTGRGLEMLGNICSAVEIPVIAIGGIGPSNVREVIEAGADGVAVISAVVGQEDMTGATRELRSLISEAKITAKKRLRKTFR